VAKLSRQKQISLIESAINGDSEAFATLHLAYDQALRRTLTALNRLNTSVVDDLSQAVWMQIFRKLATFKGDSDFGTWATRITINTALMQKRSGHKDRLNDSIEEIPISSAHRNGAGCWNASTGYLRTLVGCSIYVWRGMTSKKPPTS
jgi:DNA-directed RNA polymerase specialized sigma24 family protein